MIAWVKSWFWKPKEEEKPVEKKKIELYPRSRYSLTPSRLLEWWAQEPKLDPLPPYPPSPRKPTQE